MSTGSFSLPGYAELHCLSCFSFQRGASHPAELVDRACQLGYAALAITDECSVSGVVRAHTAWKELEPGRRAGFRLILGSEFRLDGFRLVALARNTNGWGNLCEFITAARRDARKGEYSVSRAHSDFTLLDDCEILIAPEPQSNQEREAAIGRVLEIARWARSRFGPRAWLAAELLQALDDDLWLHILQQAGAGAGVPLLAAGDVHMHVRSRKALQDVMVAVREGRPVADCGLALQASAERALRSRMKLDALYPRELLDNTLVVASRCEFDLESIKYQYPLETVPPGMTPAQALRRFTIEGAGRRYRRGVPWKVRRQLVHELRLIAECRYEMYFLTVYDIVRHAREQRILCQGRGSAANSAVCYCLHITEVDPSRAALLFERFISKERNEPPDIDIDFEHER
ncbi:PHP domain-containing protein, partial [Ramlibacter sp.]|uniref:PHP domain-containing protein n=1 Tax=Ramlibacter sp. TaxID=1917967 RepID=UPI002BA275CB